MNSTICPVTGRYCGNTGCADRCILAPSTHPGVFALPGWQCPNCGRCYSPSTQMCNYCGPKLEPTL